MISVDNLWKSYGPQVLFEGSSVLVYPRERVGLGGRNGPGQTPCCASSRVRRSLTPDPFSYPRTIASAM
jgi:ABC-type lipopolysaccharide export system ATPase subunit